MNKILHICALLVLILIFSCEKKTQALLNGVPPPYVDYRTQFIGTYTGHYLSMYTHCAAGGSPCSQTDTTYNLQNHSYTVSIDPTSDSVLIVKNGAGTANWKVNQFGKGAYYVSGGSASNDHKWKFSGDSMVYTFVYRSGYVSFGASYSFGNFYGKKQ